jgi:LPXTG-motif cell wall-anchored protein
MPASDNPVDFAPDTTVSTSEPTAEPTIENPAIGLEIPAVATPSDFRVTSPAVVPTIEPISASPTSTSPTSTSPRTASPISNSPAATIQPQIVDEVPEVAGDPTTNPLISGTVEAEATQQTAPSTSSSLPMTGASAMVLLGLAASVLAAGWLVIASRRRNNNEVA